MRRKMSWVAHGIVGMAVLMAACGGAQKEATEAAINAAQAAITAAQGDAAKYVPGQLTTTQAALQSAKDALAKGDYAAALSAAQDAASRAKDLAAAATSKKEELTKTWTSFSATFPKALDTVKGKLDAYSHGAKMPAGLDKSKLADAKTQYAGLTQGWSDAAAAFQQGNLTDASQKASALKDALARLMELLGIKS